jgi:hypothetical protein
MSTKLEKSKKLDVDKGNIDLKEETGNVTIEIKKKKGRPRKNPLLEIKPVEEVEKKKRGRKKKEKVEEEPKIKKKRGRKAALKYFSSTIRKKMPLTASIHDNDKSILHLNIKEDNNDLKKQITYDVLKNEYISSIPKINKEGNVIWDIENNENLHTNINEPSDIITSKDKSVVTYEDNDILYDYIEQSNENQLDVEELYEKRLAIRLRQDNNLMEKLQNLHQDDTLISRLLNNMEKKIESNKVNVNVKHTDNDNDTRKQGFFKVLKIFVENEKWLDKTNVCCWWCCHNFDTVPIGIPVDYNSKTNKFRVKGIFCGFSCLLAYKKSNNTFCTPRITSLITFMYKKLTGKLPNTSSDSLKNLLSITPNLSEIFDKNNQDDVKLKEQYINSITSFITIPLKEAPSRSTLKMFGGDLSIEEFRNSTKESKIYKMINYPISISRDYVEEVDLQKIKDVNTLFFNQSKSKSKSLYQQTHMQTHTHTHTERNNYTEKQIEEAKKRITTNNVIVTNNNSIDRFIKF